MYIGEKVIFKDNVSKTIFKYFEIWAYDWIKQKIKFLTHSTEF